MEHVPDTEVHQEVRVQVLLQHIIPDIVATPVIVEVVVEHLVQVLARQAIAIPAIQAANVTQVLHLIHIAQHVLPELVMR